VPVLPSPFDIHATANFIRNILLKAQPTPPRIAVVANRVRGTTQVYREFQKVLESLGIPLVAQVRDTGHYARAAEQGLGVHELEVRGIGATRAQWTPLLDWLEDDEGHSEGAEAQLAQRG